jgi:hypothetical protein
MGRKLELSRPGAFGRKKIILFPGSVGRLMSLLGGIDLIALRRVRRLGLLRIFYILILTTADRLYSQEPGWLTDCETS